MTTTPKPYRHEGRIYDTAIVCMIDDGGEWQELIGEVNRWLEDAGEDHGVLHDSYDGGFVVVARMSDQGRLP